MGLPVADSLPLTTQLFEPSGNGESEESKECDKSNEYEECSAADPQPRYGSISVGRIAPPPPPPPRPLAATASSIVETSRPSGTFKSSHGSGAASLFACATPTRATLRASRSSAAASPSVA